MGTDVRPVIDDAQRQAEQDAACVRRTLDGDVRAFDDLVDRYQRRVVSVAYRLLGNTSDAADICQEAFLRAFRSLETLDDPRRFAAWVVRIASNLSLNFRRGRHRSTSLSDDDSVASVMNDPRGERALVQVTHDPTISSEAREAIDAAIARLPEKQRLALLLFAIEGLPQKEVAEILECGIEAVKWNVFQARKKLKDELAEYITE